MGIKNSRKGVLGMRFSHTLHGSTHTLRGAGK